MKLKTEKYYFSKSSKTLNEWTGGKYYRILFSFEIWKFKIDFWIKK